MMVRCVIGLLRQGSAGVASGIKVKGVGYVRDLPLSLSPAYSIQAWCWLPVIAQGSIVV